MVPALRPEDGELIRFTALPIDHPSGRRTPEVSGRLFLPPAAGPAPAMIVLTSSAGVQRHRELYYAEALRDAGVATMVVDSFTGRGVRRTVADQSLVTAVQMEGDAFGALTMLSKHARIDPTRIGVMGVSKGAVVAVNSAIEVRRSWRQDPELEFAAHVAICPGCTAQHRNPRTTGRPMFLMLAEHDDYTPAAFAIEYAQRMRAAGQAAIRVKVYKNAHHGWETLGAIHTLRDAQNWTCCRNLIEDDGRHFIPSLGSALSEPDYQRWARANCVVTGAHAGGGTPDLKRRATADLLDFLAANGFGAGDAAGR